MTPATYPSTDRRPWQAVVDTLERAAAVCHARGGGADYALEDQISWLQRCMEIEDAAEAVREALPFQLADSVPQTPRGLTLLPPDEQPGGRSSAASPEAAEDVAPLALLEKAWDEFDRLQGDAYWLGNVPLLLASFEVADALTAVRTHYE